jgi:hypothetical protein
VAFVPGYDYDVFVSYAHGDNREWISRFAGRLESALKQKLGDPAKVWIDKDDLRATRDFRKEIPDSVKSSAVFLSTFADLHPLSLLRRNRVPDIPGNSADQASAVHGA